uniref:Fibronectin type-III domain-containing protein n=1 Tax=Cynoglossus semilaevis TaxID=244447 RepID=A0A3P8WA47_CYNSE
MGTRQLNMIKLLLLAVTLAEICAAQNDMTLSVFTVTSKTMTLQWSGSSEASSYKITITPKFSSKPPVLVHFGGNTKMASIISLSPSTVYTVSLEAMDNGLNAIGTAQTEGITAPEIPSIIQAYSKKSDSITVEFTEPTLEFAFERQWSPSAISYLLRAEKEDFFLEVPVSESPGTIIGLEPYTDYTISVMSVNSGGRSQPSYPVEVKTGTIKSVGVDNS